MARSFEILLLGLAASAVSSFAAGTPDASLGRIIVHHQLAGPRDYQDAALFLTSEKSEFGKGLVDIVRNSSFTHSGGLAGECSLQDFGLSDVNECFTDGSRIEIDTLTGGGYALRLRIGSDGLDFDGKTLGLFGDSARVMYRILKERDKRPEFLTAGFISYQAPHPHWNYSIPESGRTNLYISWQCNASSAECPAKAGYHLTLNLYDND